MLGKESIMEFFIGNSVMLHVSQQRGEYRKEQCVATELYL